MNGDAVGHKIALDPTVEDPVRYELLKKTHAVVQSLFTKYFPETPVFITFGNNDCKHHNSAPFKEEKAEFYQFMYNLWFVNHTPNRKYAALVKDTFFNGGYYSIDMSDKLTLVSLNTLEYNVDQYASEIGPEAAEQMNWLESILKQDKKVVIMTHIYAGARLSHDTTATAN